MVQEIYQQNLDPQRLGSKTLFSSAATNAAGQKVRYFSGTDAEIYFGDIFIDEVVGIQFAVQQNVMPLFGYNSYVFDDIAVGTRMVQGSFTINFTKSSFLFEILETLKTVLNSTTQSVSAEDEGTSNTLATSNNNGLNSNNPGAISSRAPLWGRSFDLVMSYGNARQANPVANSTMLMLSNVVITSCQQQLNASGEPVYESYTFIGRDLSLSPTLPNGTAATTTTPAAVVQESENPITRAVYNESLTTKKSAQGLLSIAFEANTIVKRISVEPKLELDKDRGLHPIQASTGDSGIVTYVVPDSWRAAIKKYVMDGHTDAFPMTMVVVYETNGKETIRPGEEIAVEIHEVYSDI